MGFRNFNDRQSIIFKRFLPLASYTRITVPTRYWTPTFECFCTNNKDLTVFVLHTISGDFWWRIPKNGNVSRYFVINKSWFKNNLAACCCNYGPTMLIHQLYKQRCCRESVITIWMCSRKQLVLFYQPVLYQYW